MTALPFTLPCLKPQGLQVFSTTADQRLMLGSDLFTETHFPMELRRYRNQQALETISEHDVLHQLLDNASQSHLGNRLLVLYGAAGSGKSELMTWLQLMLQDHTTDRPRLIIRISRTELDVLNVVNKLKPHLGSNALQEVTETRWAEIQRKPRTFTKLLVLRALEAQLDSDELINALYYRLIDIVEPHIVRALGMNAADHSSDFVDVLSREDFEEIQSTSVLPIDLDYEQFRFSLLEGFRKHLLDGLNLRETLTIISNQLQEKGTRPLFIIDDLVQSMNIFASDFLDYFITLDEGNWDALIGLTPASFESDVRGRELLERITYLDTIDDRIEKLWLSDQSGAQSYFLNESNCHDLAYIYLDAFRAQNGINCNGCPAYKRCASLEEGPVLSPFNKASLVRLFRGIPPGKGQARYFIRGIRESLNQMILGENPALAVARHGKAELSIETKDELVKHIATWYGTLDFQGKELFLDHSVLAFFGIEENPYPISVQTLTSLVEFKMNMLSTDVKNDTTSTAIHEWLSGQASNRQLLYGMRKGIARWVRAIVPAEYLHREHISRPWKSVRYRRVEMGISPVIAFENMDEFTGIRVTRDIGHAGFWFERFGEATGNESKDIGQHLAAESRALPIMWRSQEYRTDAINTLKAKLNMSLPSLVFHLQVFHWLIDGTPTVNTPGIEDWYWDELAKYQRVYEHHGLLNDDLRKTITQLFDDSFRLRSNLYDGFAIMRESRNYPPEIVLQNILSIPIGNLDEDYRLGKRSFKDFLVEIISAVRIVHQLNETTEHTRNSNISRNTQKILDKLRHNDPVYIDDIPEQTWTEICNNIPAVYHHLAVFIAPDRKRRNKNG